MNKEREGELILFGEIILWSFFPILTVVINNIIPALYTASISFLISGLFLCKSAIQG